MTLGLEIGLRALLTSQAALDTVGHNISNAETPGYSRQSVAVSSTAHRNVRGLLVGSGVQADTVRRVADDLISKRLILQAGSVKRLESKLDGLSLAETFFGPAGSDLGASLEGFFGAVSQLSSAPADPALRAGLVQSGVELGDLFRELHGNLDTLRRDSGEQVLGLVARVNELARRVADHNAGIVQAEAGPGGMANDLRDQRDQALRELSELVGIRYSSDAHGAVRVLVGGVMLVSPAEANQLELRADASGGVGLFLDGTDQAVPAGGGQIGGLLDLAERVLPGLQQDVDALARSVLFQVNRAHAAGIPADGPFQRLVSEHGVVDRDGDGDPLDELLSAAGLPFEIGSGALLVNVTDRATGAVEKHRLAVDAGRTTVGDLVAQLEELPHLTASIDSTGRLQLAAEAGYGFDFSRRLVSQPDAVGSFGGGQASLATPASGPYALSNGDDLVLAGALGPFTVTFDASAFSNPSQASAAEIAAVIAADANAQANGITAAAVGGRLVLQSVASGAAQSFDVVGGSALAALGLSAGTTVSGSDQAVTVEVGGAYGSSANGSLTFLALSDGDIGDTPGLAVEVLDASGNRVAVLDVGQGYRPGDELEVVDGIRVRFGAGTISATDNDLFQLEAVAEADTSNVLAALGLNGFFSGTGAQSFDVRADLRADPSRLAASVSGARGDGGVLLDLLDLSRTSFDALGGRSLGEGYDDLVRDLGLEVSSTSSAMDAEQFLLDGLQQRRDQVAGVNIDEELVHLIEHEQAFAAASQYLRVVSQITEELLSIL